MQSCTSAITRRVCVARRVFIVIGSCGFSCYADLPVPKDPQSIKVSRVSATFLATFLQPSSIVATFLGTIQLFLCRRDNFKFSGSAFEAYGKSSVWLLEPMICSQDCAWQLDEAKWSKEFLTLRFLAAMRKYGAWRILGLISSHVVSLRSVASYGIPSQAAAFEKLSIFG